MKVFNPKIQNKALQKHVFSPTFIAEPSLIFKRWNILIFFFFLTISQHFLRSRNTSIKVPAGLSSAALSLFNTSVNSLWVGLVSVRYLSSTPGHLLCDLMHCHAAVEYFFTFFILLSAHFIVSCCVFPRLLSCCFTFTVCLLAFLYIQLSLLCIL